MNTRNRATDGPGTPPGAALFRQAQEGCSNSLARLMARHEGLVHAVVRKQVLGDLPFAEALQVAALACGAPFWALTPSGAMPSPPTPGPLLCIMSGERSSLLSAPMRRRWSLSPSQRPLPCGKRQIRPVLWRDLFSTLSFGIS